MKVTPGSLTLLIGLSTGLLIALLSSLFVSLASTRPSAVAPAGSAVQEVLPAIRAVLPRPYATLVPEAPVTAKVRSGATYRFESKEGACAFSDVSTPAVVLGTVEAKWCRLLGGSIEGRFVHMLSGDRESCRVSEASCEQNPVSVWSVFDLRSHIFRPVPTPIRGGEWEAVDSVRNMGLFRGSVRSTLGTRQEDFWALTDVTGAAFWTGRVNDIDPKAQVVAGERLLSRPDNGLLLSYLAVNEAGDEILRLATFERKAWWLIELPEAVAGKTWRLESWALEKGKWTATVTVLDAEGKKETVKVST